MDEEEWLLMLRHPIFIAEEFYPDGGGSRFLRKVSKNLLAYTVSHPRAQ
jgi:hypothetical protein